MRNKHTTNIIVFTIVVFAVLLRPFFFYQIAVKQNIVNDPVAVNSLLQKLVKKKEDHHFLFSSEISAVQSVDRKMSPLLPATTYNRFKVFDKSLLAVVNIRQPNTIFMVCPPLKYYRLLSKFQI